MSEASLEELHSELCEAMVARELAGLGTILADATIWGSRATCA